MAGILCYPSKKIDFQRNAVDSTLASTLVDICPAAAVEFTAGGFLPVALFQQPRVLIFIDHDFYRCQSWITQSVVTHIYVLDLPNKVYENSFSSAMVPYTSVICCEGVRYHCIS